MPKLKLPTDLGYGNTDQKAVSCSAFKWEEFEVILPPITFDIIEEHNSDSLDGITKQKWYKLEEDDREAIIDHFKDSSGYYEWKDAFNPIMLYYWPLFLGNRDAETVAELIDEFAGCVSLIEVTGDDLRDAIGEDYALVLSGGGMDLSDRLAYAYLCAGSVPPITLLTGLSNSLYNGPRKGTSKAIRKAFALAKNACQMDMDRLKREQKKIFSRSVR